MYEMLTGQSPYYCDDIPKMYQNIKKAKLMIPKFITEGAKNLMIVILLSYALVNKNF